MSREAFGDPPETQEPPQVCPVCGGEWHAEDCEFGKEVARRLKAERAAHRMQFALHRLWPALERAMAGLVFTADRAGEVQADMNTLREYSKTPHCPKGDGPCIRGCKGWECRDGWPDDPTLKPDIAALKKRLEEDPGFAAQVTGDRPLRRNVDGVCTRSTCECEREGLGDQCVWLKPVETEFECLGEPNLCDNPRGCACFQAGRTDRPTTPVGWSDTDWLKHLEEIRQDQETYHRGPLPETGWD